MFSPGCADPTHVAQRPSIVFVVLDTVRADRFGVDTPSEARPVTPTLDRFARTAVVYRDARSPAPMTMPAMAALMTGRYGHTVGVIGHSRSDRLEANVETLAAVARRAGYRTAAVVTNPWLAVPSSGFVRGFDTFVSGRTLGRGRTRLRADDVVGEAEKILANDDGRPIFLWVHFMDAHMPYTDGVVRTRVTEDFSQSTAARSRIFFETPYSAVDIAATRAAYNLAVTQIDTALGPLLDRLPRNAIVVVLADHGESLGEHGLHFAHDFTLYDELLRVPLMLRAPGIVPGEDSTAVSLIDVMPTICALANLDCEKSLDGLRLPHTGGAEDTARFEQRTLYAASSPARARYRCPWLTVPGPEGRLTMALRGGRKLIRRPTAGGAIYEAYDLGQDPPETVNRFDSSSDHELAAALDAGLLASLRPASVPRGLPKSLARELRELGYLD